MAIRILNEAEDKNVNLAKDFYDYLVTALNAGSTDVFDDWDIVDAVDDDDIEEFSEDIIDILDGREGIAFDSEDYAGVFDDFNKTHKVKSSDLYTVMQYPETFSGSEEDLYYTDDYVVFDYPFGKALYQIATAGYSSLVVSPKTLRGMINYVKSNKSEIQKILEK